RPAESSRLLDIKRGLISLFEVISGPLFLFGVVAFLTYGTLVTTKRIQFDRLAILCAALWIAYTARLALVVLVDISSFPAINTLYLLHAFPIWTAAAMLSVWLLVSNLRAK